MCERFIDSLVGGRLGKFFRPLGILVAVGIVANVALALFTTDRAVFDSSRATAGPYLVAALGLTLVPWICNTIRTFVWVRFLGHPMSAREAYRIVLATELGSAVTPTAAGGGYVKLAMLVQRGLSVGTATSLMLLASLENAVFFAAAVPAALLFTGAWDLSEVRAVLGALPDRAGRGVLIAIVLFLIVFGALMLLRHRIGEGFGRLRRDFLNVYGLIAKRGKLRFVTMLGLTSVQWACRYSVITVLLAGLGVHGNPLLFWMLQWVVFTAMTAVPTPGGAGGAEAAFMLMYGAFVPTEVLGLATATWRFLTFYVLLCMGGVIFATLTIWAPAGGVTRRRSGSSSYLEPVEAAERYH